MFKELSKESLEDFYGKFKNEVKTIKNDAATDDEGVTKSGRTPFEDLTIQLLDYETAYFDWFLKYPITPSAIPSAARSIPDEEVISSYSSTLVMNPTSISA